MKAVLVVAVFAVLKSPPNFWDIAFVIGILIQVTKLADWILRPKQREWVENFFDSIALHLEYLKPLAWFKAFGDPRVQIVVMGTVTLILLVRFRFVVHRLFPRFSAESLNWWIIALVVFSLVTTAFVMIRWGVKIVRWIYAEGKFSSFFMRWLAFFMCCTPVVGLAVSIPKLTEAIYAFPSPWSEVVAVVPMLLLTLCLGFLCAAAIIVGTGYLAIVSQLVLMFMSLIISVLRFIVWRIVEYNKGAWAALSLLVTVVCGIIASYLRFQAE